MTKMTGCVFGERVLRSMVRALARPSTSEYVCVICVYELKQPINPDLAAADLSYPVDSLTAIPPLSKVLLSIGPNKSDFSTSSQSAIHHFYPSIEIISATSQMIQEEEEEGLDALTHIAPSIIHSTRVSPHARTRATIQR